MYMRNMHSFCMRYAIALVFVLTRKCTFACFENGTCERTNPAKVVTSFLKVPWVNLNTSWTDGPPSQCRNDVITLFESADAGEIWALEMLDATSRIPSGIFMGNIIDLGNYDECVDVRSRHHQADIQGQHCMVSLSIPTKFVRDASVMLHMQKLSIHNPSADVGLGLTLSVCLPSTCSVEEVVGLIESSISSRPVFTEFDVSIARVRCSGIKSSNDLTIGTILTIFFFAMIGSILLSCTVCDFFVRIKSKNVSLTLKTLAKFSVYTNAIKLLSTKKTPETMPAIHGIRFLSSFMIVILHRSLLTMLNPLVNLSDVYEIRQSVLASLILMLPYAVDTFFIISGFLAAYPFLKKRQLGVKFNVLEFYFHRYIRLTPCVATLLLLGIHFIPYFESGPMWQTFVGDGIDYCRKNWWINLLFVHNLANREEMCIPHTWYSAVEMQFFLLCPIVLYPLFYRPKLGLTMLGALSIASMITPALQIFLNNYSFFFNFTKNNSSCFVEFFDSYTITYNRALPYLVGILLGYDVANNKRHVTKMQAVLNWILTCVFVLFCFWNTQFIQPNAPAYHAVSEAAYVSLGRLVWSLAMAWILYASTQGCGGPVTRFLSLPIFTPLSRMSYNIYLVHFLIQVGDSAVKRTAEFYTPFAVMHLVWGDLVMSIAVAFVLNVCIETPALTLEEIMKAKRPTETIHHAFEDKKKKEKLSTLIGEYLDLTRDLVASDLDAEMKMGKIYFWQTVSDVLNTLSKRPKMTSGEWAKTWRQWRNDIQRETGAKDTQNGATQIRTRVPTLEQELLTFLLAMSCGFGSAANFQASDIMELIGSYKLGSSEFQNKDLTQLSTSNSTPLAKKIS